MSVIVTDPALLWNGYIPYVIQYAGSSAWVKSKIDEFNSQVGMKAFVPMGSEADYLVFKLRIDDPTTQTTMAHSGCVVGRRGGAQDITFKMADKSIWHEMAHACGLGHEQFHESGARQKAIKEKYPDLAGKSDAEIKKANIGMDQVALTSGSKYTSVGGFDEKSIMLYSKYFDTHEVCLSDDDCRAIRSLLSIGGAGAKVGAALQSLRGAAVNVTKSR
jgi:hypothetical protein